MKQDGEKEIVEEVVIADRKVFFVDVGDMPPKEALRILNELRKKQGQAPVSTSWSTWLFVGLSAAILSLYLATIFNVL